jgi:D-sedoheptulose 7-phosphate isomerase
LPALALPLDSSSVTACSNDLGFDAYFERMVQAHGRRGDTLVGITTSGASQNVNRALSTARDLGLSTVGLLGSGGGAAAALCDVSIVVPPATTARIQECHIAVGHVLVELVEDMVMSDEQQGR